jgi:hypothetical protein
MSSSLNRQYLLIPSTPCLLSSFAFAIAIASTLILTRWTSIDQRRRHPLQLRLQAKRREALYLFPRSSFSRVQSQIEACCPRRLSNALLVFQYRCRSSRPCSCSSLPTTADPEQSRTRSR